MKILGMFSMLNLLVIMFVFLVGFISANFISLYFNNDMEVPLFDSGLNVLDDWGLVELYFDKAPSNFVDEDFIEVYEDRVILWVDGVSISSYAPTGSMKPVLDENSNGIRIVPESEEDIREGDIVSFLNEKGLIVHRVIEKGRDGLGIYFITKGDNNSVEDGKIRFDDIKYKTIGVIW